MDVLIKIENKFLAVEVFHLCSYIFIAGMFREQVGIYKLLEKSSLLVHCLGYVGGVGNCFFYVSNLLKLIYF